MPRGENFKGKRPPGAGRKKGTLNRETDLKRRVMGVDFDIAAFAAKFPVEFVQHLLCKYIPKQIEQSGPDRGPIVIESNVKE